MFWNSWNYLEITKLSNNHKELARNHFFFQETYCILHSQWIFAPPLFDDLAFCVGEAYHYELLGGGFKISFLKTIHPYPGRFFPIWLAHIFEMGWFNHQLDCDYQVRPSNPPPSCPASYESLTCQSSSCRLGHQNATLPADAWIAGGTGFRCGKEWTYCWWFRNPATVLYVTYPIIYRGFIHPKWCRILPSTLFPGEYEGRLMWHCHLRIDNDV